MSEKFDTSWFDLSKYDFLKESTLADWEKMLYFRNCFYSFICNEEKSEIENCNSTRNFIWIIKNFLPATVCRTENSSKSNFTHNPELPFNTHSVRSLSVLDAYLRGDAINYSPNAWLACQVEKGTISTSDDIYKEVELLIQQRKPTKHLSNEVILNEPIDFLIKDTKRKTRNTLSSVTIDLEATDEQILKDFQHWLIEYRKAIKESAPSKNFSDETLSDWVKWQLLPYIDLMTVAKYEGKKLHHHAAGVLLFPDEFEVDPTERIRRTTKPKAEWLIQTETIRAIETQLANSST